MNSNIHWGENGLCIVPAMLAHCQEPVTVTTSLKKYLTHEYQWIESHGMTWLDNLLRGNTREGASYAPPRLIDWPARYKVGRIRLCNRNCISKWTSDLFTCRRIKDAHVQSVRSKIELSGSMWLKTERQTYLHTKQTSDMCLDVCAHLWGMCCVRSWWNSGRGEGSCLRSGPASQGGWCCSRPHSGTWQSLPLRSDLHEHNTAHRHVSQKVHKRFDLVQTGTWTPNPVPKELKDESEDILYFSSWKRNHEKTRTNNNINWSSY